jgi:hypothetical protein
LGDVAYALEHLTLIVTPGDHARAYLRLLEIEAAAIVDARCAECSAAANLGGSFARSAPIQK